METKSKFLALIESYGLPAKLFEITEDYSYHRGPFIEVLYAPHKIHMVGNLGGLQCIWAYELYIYKRITHLDKFFAPIITEYKLGCENDRLKEEIAKLREENTALRLLPGAPEYFAAKEHYESLAKK